MTLPATIDEVLAELDRIIAVSVEKNSSIAIFAYIYRRTTAEIKKAVDKQFFEDNARMAAMDVAFANLYIQAYHDYAAGLPVSACWKLAFDGAKKDLAILQHIVLGMNAHINLDLGVSASRLMVGKPLEDIKTDFMRVNDILFTLTAEMQRSLGRTSLLLFLADWMGQRNDEQLVNFSIGKARFFSWNTANHLWNASDAAECTQRTTDVDKIVAQLGYSMANPPTRGLRWVLKLIHRFESKEVKKIVAAMQQHS